MAYAAQETVDTAHLRVTSYVMGRARLPHRRTEISGLAYTLPHEQSRRQLRTGAYSILIALPTSQ